MYKYKIGMLILRLHDIKEDLQKISLEYQNNCFEVEEREILYVHKCIIDLEKLIKKLNIM